MGNWEFRKRVVPRRFATTTFQTNCHHPGNNPIKEPAEQPEVGSGNSPLVLDADPRPTLLEMVRVHETSHPFPMVPSLNLQSSQQHEGSSASCPRLYSRLLLLLHAPSMSATGVERGRLDCADSFHSLYMICAPSQVPVHSTRN